jgi:hypothetical protein
MPLAYADQFYVLREHIGFVRARLTRDPEAATAAAARDVAGEAQSVGSAGSADPTGSPDEARAHSGVAISRAEARAASHETHEDHERSGRDE